MRTVPCTRNVTLTKPCAGTQSPSRTAADKEDSSPEELSGSQNQRKAIARAPVCKSVPESERSRYIVGSDPKK
jgi:ABC-type glutathione transport system ATPase component